MGLPYAGTGVGPDDPCGSVLGGHSFRIQHKHAACPDPVGVFHTNITNKNNF